MSDDPDDWTTFYDKTRHRPPRETLIRALDLFDQEGLPANTRRAVDLGCGGGRDTVELLRRGWKTLAIDSESVAIRSLMSRPDLGDARLLETRTARFEETELPASHFVNASFALPLCPPEAFPALWQRIVDALVSGGRFARPILWAAR